MDGLAAVASTPSTLLPVRIQDWTKSASELFSKAEFTRRAVGVACMLTDSLIRTYNIDNDSASRFVSPRDMGAGDILLFVPNACNLSVENVQFKHSSYERSSQESLCAALGTVFLYIFSKGRSIALKSETTACSVSNGGAMPSSGGFEAGSLPQAKKISSSSTNENNSFHNKASNLLRDVGMPTSICNLVRDLLAAPNNYEQEYSDEYDGNEFDNNIMMPLRSLEECLWELTQMKSNPKCFLYDRTCPKQALDDTGLYGNSGNQNLLFGREKEMKSLLDSMRKISSHVREGGQYDFRKQSVSSSPTTGTGAGFLVETTFLSGYAGIGKSSLLHSLANACNDDSWFVISCKFDKLASPHVVIGKALDAFFGKWLPLSDGSHPDARDPTMVQSFMQICRALFASLDDLGFNQVCDLIPNFARVSKMQIFM